MKTKAFILKNGFAAVTITCFLCINVKAQAINSTELITDNNSPIRSFYGQASFYANKFNGRKTANGEIFSQNKMTAACNALPLGTWIKVTNMRNGKYILVKTNDRLHMKMKRVLDLSHIAAEKLDYIKAGLTRVKIEVLGKNQPK